MAFGGIKQTAAYGELVSVGGLNANINKKLSATISTIQNPKLIITSIAHVVYSTDLLIWIEIHIKVVDVKESDEDKKRD
ncbi:hypothetical protein LguiA_009366 [Lonicera macranthoides]